MLPSPQAHEESRPVVPHRQRTAPTTSIPIALPVDGRPFIVTLPEPTATERCIVQGNQKMAPTGIRQQAFPLWRDRQTLEIQMGK
jgi:hypothetical protein